MPHVPRITNSYVLPLPRGGSIAGLTAAAILAAHYDTVIIIEPDKSVNDEHALELPPRNETRLNPDGVPIAIPPRKRVSQWYGSHSKSGSANIWIARLNWSRFWIRRIVFLPPAYNGLNTLFGELLHQELAKMNCPSVSCAKLGSN